MDKLLILAILDIYIRTGVLTPKMKLYLLENANIYPIIDGEYCIGWDFTK